MWLLLFSSNLTKMTKLMHATSPKTEDLISKGSFHDQAIMDSITLQSSAPNFHKLDTFLQSHRIVELRHQQLQLLSDSIAIARATANRILDGYLIHTVSLQQHHQQQQRQQRQQHEQPIKTKDASRQGSRRGDDFWLVHELFDNHLVFSYRYDNPRRGLAGYWHRYLDNVKRQLNTHLYRSSAHSCRLRPTVVSCRTPAAVLQSVRYGYLRLRPLDGIELVLYFEHHEQPVRVRTRFTRPLFREDTIESSHSLLVDDQELRSKSFFGRLVDAVLSSLLSSSPSIDLEKVMSPAARANALTKRTHWSSAHIEYFAEARVAHKTVNFVLALKGRWRVFKRFMRHFAHVLLDDANESRVRLVVVLFEDHESALVLDDDDHDDDVMNDRGMMRRRQARKQSELISMLFRRLRLKYQGKVLNDTLRLLTIGTGGAAFSRSLGCELGAALFDAHELLFFVDVDMLFTSDLLARIRANTIRGKQVYYPIVFNEYNRDDPLDAVRFFLTGKKQRTNLTSAQTRRWRRRRPIYGDDDDDGFWIYYGYGMVSAYNEDLRRVGGFNVSIVGWGHEDVDLYAKFVRSNVSVFAAVEPALVHVFHHMDCDRRLGKQQMTMCVGSKSAAIASQRHLARIIYEKRLHKM